MKFKQFVMDDSNYNYWAVKYFVHNSGRKYGMDKEGDNLIDWDSSSFNTFKLELVYD